MSGSPIFVTDLDKSAIDLDLNLKIYTGSVLKIHEKEFPEIIEKEKTDLRSEKMMRYEGNGAAPELRGEGLAPDTTSMREGYVETCRQRTYAHDMPITWEARKYAVKNARIVSQMAEYQARSVILRYEFSGVDPINNGTSVAFLGGDGASYFSASHKWKSNPSATWSNLFTASALSMTSIENNLITIGQATMEHDIPAMLMVKKIHIGTANIFRLPKILQTQQEPDSANNTKNIVATLGLKQNINHYLADTNAYTYDTQQKTRVMLESHGVEISSDMETRPRVLLQRAICAFGTMFHDSVGSYHNQGA